MGFKYSQISSREIKFIFSSSTASWRSRMAARSMSGCSIQLRSIRAPMAVLVRSSTHRRDPLFCFSLSVSTSSRFRLVEVSSIMYCPGV